MSWYPKFSGSHFGLPSSSIHSTTALGGNFLWNDSKAAYFLSRTMMKCWKFISHFFFHWAECFVSKCWSMCAEGKTKPQAELFQEKVRRSWHTTNNDQTSFTLVKVEKCFKRRTIWRFLSVWVFSLFSFINFCYMVKSSKLAFRARLSWYWRQAAFLSYTFLSNWTSLGPEFFSNTLFETQAYCMCDIIFTEFNQTDVFPFSLRLLQWPIDWAMSCSTAWSTIRCFWRCITTTVWSPWCWDCFSLLSCKSSFSSAVKATLSQRFEKVNEAKILFSLSLPFFVVCQVFQFFHDQLNLLLFLWRRIKPTGFAETDKDAIMKERERERERERDAA